MAGGGGGSNTTHALLSPDPETLPMGEVSRPATGEFLGTKQLQGRPTVAPYAPLTAGPNSTLSQRYGPAIIPQELVAENGLFLTRFRGGPATGRCGGHTQVSRQAKHYAHKGINALSCDKAFQNPCHSAKRERKYVQQHIRICTHGVKTGQG